MGDDEHFMTADMNELSDIELEGVFCEFCHKVGLDYVSCSPYRVPIARLAAAQAAIAEKKGA